MASGDTALQLLTTQRYGEAGSGCSLLLRRWPIALQLAALLQQWQQHAAALANATL